MNLRFSYNAEILRGGVGVNAALNDAARGTPGFTLDIVSAPHIEIYRESSFHLRAELGYSRIWGDAVTNLAVMGLGPTFGSQSFVRYSPNFVIGGQRGSTVLGLRHGVGLDLYDGAIGLEIGHNWLNSGSSSQHLFFSTLLISPIVLGALFL